MVVKLEPGKYFFHYTTRDAAFDGILPSGALRLSTYGAMRDPLENQPWRFTFTGYGERDDAQLSADLGAYDKFERRANDGIRNSSHLLSLTIDTQPTDRGEREPFCRGWARARMWEQYAEKHKGVCLVFDRDLLVQSLEEALAKTTFAARYHQPVQYTGRGMEKPIVERSADTPIPDQVVPYIEKNHVSLFFTKMLDWETEHEYRFVAISDETPLELDYGSSLTAVIAGERFPGWEYPAAIAACREAGAKPLLVKWKNWRPGLVELKHGT